MIDLAIIIPGVWMFGDPEILKFGSWPIAEWLINYEGGFVRRGLIGQLLYIFSAGESVIQSVNIITLILFYLYVAIFLSVYFYSRIKNWYVLVPALLIPGGIVQMGLTMQFFTRKEIIFLLLFGVLCLITLAIKRSSAHKKTIFNSLLFLLAIIGGIICTFVHEGYVFMGYPLTLVLLWTNLKNSVFQRLYCFYFALYFFLIPAIFILSSVFHGDMQSANNIWNSLNLSDRVLLSPAAPYSFFGPIASMGWGLQQHFLTLYGIFATDAYLYWPIFILGNYLVMFFVFCVIVRTTHHHASIFNRYMLFGVISSFLMYFIAADWGRWLSFSCNSLLMLAFTFASQNQPESSQSKLVQEHGPSNKTQFSEKYFLAIFALLVAYSLVFRLPECCLSSTELFTPYLKLISLSL
ncbi:hypothetical protein [Polynucleobacter arcticus]